MDRSGKLCGKTTEIVARKVAWKKAQSGWLVRGKIEMPSESDAFPRHGRNGLLVLSELSPTNSNIISSLGFEDNRRLSMVSQI